MIPSLILIKLYIKSQNNSQVHSVIYYFAKFKSQNYGVLELSECPKAHRTLCYMDLLTTP